MVAPHIFMMAISSRRLKVASLMVLAIMNRLTANRITTRITATAPAMLRMTVKPSAISGADLVLATPVTSFTAFSVSVSLLMSSR